LLKKEVPLRRLTAEGRNLAATPRKAFPGVDGFHMQEAAHCLGSALEEMEHPAAAGIAIASLARVLWTHLGIKRQELEWQVERTRQMLEQLAVKEAETARLCRSTFAAAIPS
jgi:hypothetical protein